MKSVASMPAMSKAADLSRGLLESDDEEDREQRQTPKGIVDEKCVEFGEGAKQERVASKRAWQLYRKIRHWAQECLPILKWLPSYNVSKSLQGDAVGGITIGMVALAQTLAHASIATTNSIQGPYCAFIPTLTYAIFGTSPHTSVSSGAIAAILIADQLRPWSDIQERTELASLLAFISGCVLILMGWLKAAFAVRFLSQSTLSGFISAGAILIMVQQGRNFLGYVDFPQTGGFFEHIRIMVEWLPQTDPGSAVMGVSFLMLLDGLNRLKAHSNKMIKKGCEASKWRKVKQLAEMKEILVASLGILFSFLSSFLTEDGSSAVTVVGHIPAGLPPLRAPWDTQPFEQLMQEPHRRIRFVFGGVLVALTSFLTTYATTKKMALKFGYRLNASQELIALGSAGVAGSFFGAFPPSGSLSRTGLAAELGVKTQLGGVFAAGVIGLGLLFLAPAISFLPKAALAAIIMKSSMSLLDFDYPRELWRSYWKPKNKGGLRRDFRIWVIAFITTLFMGVLWGIGLAVLVDVLLVVRDASQPSAVILGRVGELGRKWQNLEDWPTAEIFEGIMVFEFRGPLSFASAEWFQEAVERHRLEYNEKYGAGQVKIVVLSFTSVHYLDKTALVMLKDLVTEWSKTGVGCVISGAKSQVRALVEKVLVEHVDQTDFLISINDAVNIARRRLAGHQQHNRGLKPATGNGVAEANGNAGRKIQRDFKRRPTQKVDTAMPRCPSAPNALNEDVSPRTGEARVRRDAPSPERFPHGVFERAWSDF